MRVVPDRFGVKNQEGQGLAEYVIIVVVVALIVLIALRYFGVGVGNQFSDAKRKVDSIGGSEDSGSSALNDAGDADSSAADDAGEQRASADSPGLAPRGGGERGSSESSEDLGALADSVSSGVGDSEVIAAPIRVNTSTLLFLFGLAVAIAVVLLVRYAKKNRKMIDKGKKKKSKRKGFFSLGKDDSGQAMVEFVLSVITFLFCVLGVIQLALCLNTYALVRYAAYNAARAGIVHEGDLSRMREAARQSLLAVFPRHGRADHQLGFTENYLGALATDQFPLPLYGFRPITDVRILNLEDESSGAVITFDDPEDAPRALLTAEVTHHYELVVPLVNRILYYLHRRWVQSFKTARWGEDSVDKLAAVTDRERRGGNLEDIEFRIPIVAHYTMRMQSDLVVP